MNSKATLQPFPTLKEAINEILTLYMEERGHGDFFDSYRTIAQSDLKEVGLALYEKMCEMSDKAMVENGRCPGCGGKLVQKYTPGTSFDTPNHWIECSECRDEVEAV